MKPLRRHQVLHDNRGCSCLFCPLRTPLFHQSGFPITTETMWTFAVWTTFPKPSAIRKNRKTAADNPNVRSSMMSDGNHLPTQSSFSGKALHIYTMGGSEIGRNGTRRLVQRLQIAGREILSYVYCFRRPWYLPLRTHTSN